MYRLHAHEHIEYTLVGVPKTTASFAVAPTCVHVWPKFVLRRTPQPSCEYTPLYVDDAVRIAVGQPTANSWI